MKFANIITVQTAPLLNNLLKDTSTATKNALQYLDVLLTVKSLTENKYIDIVKVYLAERNQDDADTFALVAIVSVVSNSDDTWLWYTVQSWYKQIVPGTATIPTYFGLQEVYSGTETQK